MAGSSVVKAGAIFQDAAIVGHASCRLHEAGEGASFAVIERRWKKDGMLGNFKKGSTSLVMGEGAVALPAHGRPAD